MKFYITSMFIYTCSFDIVIVDVVVNDLLNGNSQLKINQLIENIKEITQKCVSFGVDKICFVIGVYNKGRFVNIRKFMYYFQIFVEILAFYISITGT